MRGRVAVVTCAERGFGAAIVRGLVQTGAITCGTGSPPIPEWESIKDESYIRCNVSNPLTFQFLCQELYEKYGKLNILVNITEINAPFKDSNLEVKNLTFGEEIIETNLRTTLSASKIAAKYMKQSGGGSIINIISLNSLASLSDNLSYVAFKDELLIRTKKMARQLIEDNVHVNNIFWGYPQNGRETGREEISNTNENNGLQDLIRATVFFAAKGSSCITGQGIFILCEEQLIHMNS